MKNLLPLFILITLTVGCNRYQYLTINSSNVQQNTEREFVVENDSLQIVYSFKGENVPVNIRIYNKLGRLMASTGPGQFITDRAYVKKATGFSTGFGIVAGVAVLGAVAAASAQTSN